ncbi:MAG: DNA repair protein RadC [Deltaproteobacteria bacterium]|nr:DNA repair protein RadC [Deltaproteobacteria bacterium]
MNKEQFWEKLISGEFVSMVRESSKGRTLKSSLEAYNILKPLFADEDDVERMFFIFMDQKNQIISTETLFRGSIAGSAIYPREVIKQIIRLKANAIVMAHNHPSGDTYPSQEDKSITFRVMLATSVIDVNLLDHIIIGVSYYSMADEGIIKTMKNQLNDFMKGV